ncbi:cytoplasmic dynein 2 intermediate chain 2-like [Amphibalanus amphitrite]|uniref:cytoplasmic dynein 2 intermediate chain 2-like n=1 Tax=Amphibalanus amphitrite TaxID=1232801 RepID=UPI001C91098A|nr:cytoplasmic dynein 2 intermediate chain 2-like [Amphibalanus amphitrite]XP_043241260.1 cytoplasmic dynein 2 intermediate chain 2-like [Amphibalanus amphitrite]XP_043241269.1 cytoplasmic dynein 2 intermediate chain 2-like [Amphibalanus amphitrite]XP_043241278.1 cytoplasmic dynein 2 intermediate chain 2-like [Amphibalanus amphitrite]XP_043241291.1 cytoplasmic dynein 2 intermediate chain 2-like [Amphibalanus amphitrite]XP_043241299.1 cytoplasmic dynein 2 intermediate chain 2-like [Amphibalanus
MLKFKDVNFDVIGFKSSWKAKSKQSESGSQTEPLKIEESETQTIGHDEKESQTDPEPEVVVPPADAAVQPSLVAFLGRAVPLVLRELERSEKSRAFDGYQLIEEDDDQPVRRLLTLRLAGRPADTGTTGDQVSCLSWSCTGSVVAVGYGAGEHQSWCEHSTSLALWNVHRKDLNPNQPYQKLELRSCASYCRFHPSEPSVLAVGMVTGELQLYNLSREEDPLLGTTSGIIQGHREPVSALHWLARSAGYSLVSASRDGRMLVWKYSEAKQQLQLVKQFQLMAGQVPRSAGRRAARADSEAGLTALAFSHDNPDQFTIGSEGGGVFLCSFASEVPITAMTGERTEGLLNPVTSTFEPHQGQVLVLQCSKFHRNIFISAGSDNEVRVYNTLQISPLLSISLEAEVTAAALSPSRPLVVFVTTGSGEQHLFDFTRRGAPLHTMRLHEKPLVVTALRLNDKQPSLLATGDAKGAVHVWSLATEYVSPKTHELAEINRLGGVQTDG